MNTKVIDIVQKTKSFLVPDGLEFINGPYYHSIELIEQDGDKLIVTYIWSKNVRSSDPQDEIEGDGIMEVEILTIDPDYDGNEVSQQEMNEWLAVELLDRLKTETEPYDGLDL